METSEESKTPSAAPIETSKDQDVVPANRASNKEALGTPKEQQSRGTNENASSGTDSAPAAAKMITLSTLSNKRGDTDNKRSRSSAEQLSDQEQPLNKRPPSELSLALNNAQGMMIAAREHPTDATRSEAMRATQQVTSIGTARSLEREEAVQEDVKRSWLDLHISAPFCRRCTSAHECTRGAMMSDCHPVLDFVNF